MTEVRLASPIAEGNVLVQTGQDVTRILQKTRLAPMTQKDTWDVFSSLVISMGVSTHKKLFKSYQNTFTSSEALKHLSSLNLIRSPDVRPELANPIPLSIHATNTPESSASVVMQHLINACLIRDATMPTSIGNPNFEKRGLYEPTPKGLRVLEEFIQLCALGSDADHLVAVLSTQSTPRPFLIRLSRHVTSDDLILTQPIVHNLFRKFVGRWPRFTHQKTKENLSGILFMPKYEAADALNPLFKKDAIPLEGRISSVKDTMCLRSPWILDWLCTHTTVTSPREAAELAAEFVRRGLLVLVKQGSGSGTMFEVPNNGISEDTNATFAGEFYYSPKAVYAVTDQGSIVAGWTTNLNEAITASLSLRNGGGPPIPRDQPLDPANGQRLKTFIRDPTMRSLFRRFLSEIRCSNDLAFWLDVEDFRSEYETAHNLASTTISVDLTPVEGSSSTPLDPSPQPESQHGALANRPFLIFNTYLTPKGSMQISFDVGQDLLEELQSNLQQCTELLTNQILFSETGDPFADPAQIGLEQLSVIVWIYQRIQNRVFSVMADNLIPKFIRWPAFLESRLQNPLVPSISALESATTEPEVEVKVDKGKGKARSDD